MNEDLAARATHYTLHLINETNDNTTLDFEIDWHPNSKRSTGLTLDTFSKIKEEYVAGKADITIQGRKGVLVTFKGAKTYMGSNQAPNIKPPTFIAFYFLDDHTEVRVIGNVPDWSAQDFEAMLSSLKITPPVGYY